MEYILDSLPQKQSPLKYGFSYKDLIKEGRVDENDLKKLMEWLKDEPLPKYNEEMMCLFYMACKNDIEDTKKCARMYYYTRRDAPELFDERDMTRPDIRHQLSILEFCLMPRRTKEGYIIITHRLVDPYPPEYHMDVAMKILIMTMDSSLYEDPPTGLVVLFDMNKVGLRHLTRIKLWAVKKFLLYVQEGLPLQLKAVHVLNCVWFIDKILTVIKPFYKPELLELLHFHKSDIDMDEFYENHIPKSCLPSDYGGDLEAIQELHEKNTKRLEELQDYYDQEESLRSNVE